MKKTSSKLVLFLAGLVMVLSVGRVRGGGGAVNEAKKPAGSEAKQPAAKPAAAEKPEGPAEGPAAEGTAEPSIVVAEIGDYVITKDDLVKRLMTELQPYDYDGFGKAEPTDAKKVLLTMIAEKAMIMQGRKEGEYLKKEMNYSAVKRLRERRITNLLMQKHLVGKLTVTESEIEARMKADPKLDKARAKQMAERTKANAILGQYYTEIYKKSNVRKMRTNYLKAAQLHQRLLYRPKAERKVPWIRNSQIRDELTEEEKNIVLATFDKGKVTMKDWFETLGEIVPSGRPQDLHTPQGVDALLERSLRTPLLVSEAVSLGFDKDENLKKQVREDEDRILLGESKQARNKEVEDPTTEEMKAYLKEHEEQFRQDRKLKIDQIWCSDLKTAEKAKGELDEGKDFESVKQKYTLDKEGKAVDISPGTEAYFWKDLWEGDPNEVVGPVKGSYRGEFKWRIVKILEKHPGKVIEFSDDVQERVKWRIRSEKGDALLEKYCKELLGKYSYKLYADRIKDINPLDIP
ncbi:MAG: peptidyl-prolyl cis-trans isomerase [Planctomycetes bacterium]|nr:peptidyl-prolyl cis-trans isomerase [Planctomycetota bacterium]